MNLLLEGKLTGKSELFDVIGLLFHVVKVHTNDSFRLNNTSKCDWSSAAGGCHVLLRRWRCLFNTWSFSVWHTLCPIKNEDTIFLYYNFTELCHLQNCFTHRLSNKFVVKSF